MKSGLAVAKEYPHKELTEQIIAQRLRFTACWDLDCWNRHMKNASAMN
jgi:hypothetical protein